MVELDPPTFAQNLIMKAASEDLIDDLLERTRTNINRVTVLSSYTDDQLNWKACEGKWSVLECVEHLNRYAEFYNPEIESRIENAKPSSNGKFRSSWFGEYFAKSMLPKENLNKMKTFDVMNPMNGDLDRAVLDRFQNFQWELLDLLGKSRKVDLIKTKTSISISKIIKLRLGDTYRVVIYHNQRHILQAEKAIADQLA